MEYQIQDLLSEACGRPRHFTISAWYDLRSVGNVDSWISVSPRAPEHEMLRVRKANRRLEQWWLKQIDDETTAPSSEKLADAKRSNSAPEGKRERVCKILSRAQSAFIDPLNSRGVATDR